MICVHKITRPPPPHTQTHTHAHTHANTHTRTHTPMRAGGCRADVLKEGSGGYYTNDRTQLNHTIVNNILKALSSQATRLGVGVFLRACVSVAVWRDSWVTQQGKFPRKPSESPRTIIQSSCEQYFTSKIYHFCAKYFSSFRNFAPTVHNTMATDWAYILHWPFNTHREPMKNI